MKKCIQCIVMVNILIIAAFCSNSNAQDSEALHQVYMKIIKIGPDGAPNPAEIISSPGTVITWVNHANLPKEILFQGGELKYSCGTLTSFFVNQNGCFESNKISNGETASLCFIKKGKYAYTIKTSTFYLDKNEKVSTGIISIQ